MRLQRFGECAGPLSAGGALCGARRGVGPDLRPGPHGSTGKISDTPESACRCSGSLTRVPRQPTGVLAPCVASHHDADCDSDTDANPT